jgi:hypothetical protein
MSIQPNGIEKILPIGTLSDYETTLLAVAIPELAGSIDSTFRLLFPFVHSLLTLLIVLLWPQRVLLSSPLNSRVLCACRLDRIGMM